MEALLGGHKMDTVFHCITRLLEKYLADKGSGGMDLFQPMGVGQIIPSLSPHGDCTVPEMETCRCNTRKELTAEILPDHSS